MQNVNISCYYHVYYKGGRSYRQLSQMKKKIKIKTCGIVEIENNGIENIEIIMMMNCVYSVFTVLGGEVE